MGLSNLSRILYIASELHPPIPPKSLLKLVPQSDLIISVAKNGSAGASSDLDIPASQLEGLIAEGRDGGGSASEQEFRTLLAQTMLAELELNRDNISMTAYLETVREITNFMEATRNQIIALEEQDLGDLSNGDVPVGEIPKYDTGFSPLDVVLDGAYQAIATFIGRPGHGKTSLMISLMEALRETNAASSIWYFEQEIPLPMMRYRFGPAAGRVRFLKGKDRLICGQQSIEAIEQLIRDDPDPNRVVIIDSPDVMVGGTGDQKRFAIEDVYMGMIRLKPLTKTIFVTSWPRKQDKTITIESGAEAWAKAWYSDIMVGLVKLGRSTGGFTNYRLNVVKNRFGLSDNEVMFEWNLVNLMWKLNEGQRYGAEEARNTYDW